MKGLGLAVDEVIHHDDVMPAIIIRTRGLTSRNPDRRDARVVEFDTDEGQACIARRGRDKTANIRLPSRSKYSISVLALCGLPPSGRSTSVKTTPKPVTVAGEAPLVPGTKNEPSVTLLPTGVNNRDGLKVVKMVA